MPVKWDAETEADLLLAIYAVTTPAELSKEQKDEIVNIMKQKGHDIVWNAIR